MKNWPIIIQYRDGSEELGCLLSMNTLERNLSIRNCLILTLSHGQSSTESGFSNKKDILDNNMSQETLFFALRAHGLKTEKKEIHRYQDEAILMSTQQTVS